MKMPYINKTLNVCMAVVMAVSGITFAASADVVGDNCVISEKVAVQNGSFELRLGSKTGKQLGSGNVHNGTASASISVRNLESGRNLIVIVNSETEKGIGQAYCNVSSNTSGTSGGTSNGDHGGGTVDPGGGTVVQDKPDTHTAEDLRKIRLTAEREAGMVSNQIVIGKAAQAERIRYNLAQGMRAGLLNAESRFATFPTYLQGKNQGRTDGYGAGSRDGKSAGSSDGYSRGSSIAASRFESIVVNEGQTPKALDKSEPTESVTPPSKSPSALTQYDLTAGLIARQNDYYAALAEAQSYADGYVLVYDSWRNEYTIDAIYRTSTPLNSYPSEERAYLLWRDYYRTAETLEHFNRVTDTSKYTNGDEARSTYVNAFKRKYRQVIDEKWADAVTARLDSAYNRGYAIGVQVAHEYAFRRGYNETYSAAYSTGYSQGYLDAYRPSLVNGFRTTFQRYNDNVLITAAEVEILPAQGSRFVPGTALNAQVKTARNAGGQAGTVNVSLESEAVYEWPAKTIDVRPSTITLNRTLEQLGEIGPEAPAKGKMAVTVKVGGMSVRKELEISWWNTIEEMAKNANSSTPEGKRIFERTKKHVLTKLGEEWFRLGDKGDQNFGSGRGHDTLIMELTRVYDQAVRNGNEAVKAGMKKIAWDLIVHVYDNKSLNKSGLLGSRGNNHKAINAYLRGKFELK